MSDPLDVSGTWEGVFNYPRALPSTGFRAELREAAGGLAGETHEPGDGGETLVALLAGQRSGDGVTFTKRYDDPARAGHPIHYAGTLTPDGDEIAGRWDIPGIWSGSFIMVGASRRAAPATIAVAETVR